MKIRRWFNPFIRKNHDFFLERLNSIPQILAQAWSIPKLHTLSARSGLLKIFKQSPATSSANREIFDWMPSSMSFKKIKKSRGDNIESWGTEANNSKNS